MPGHENELFLNNKREQIAQKTQREKSEIKSKSLLTFGEKVGPGPILTDIKVFPQLVTGFKSEHGVIVQSIISEQDDTSRLEYLKDTCTTKPLEKVM